jgi:hypothetical protein
MLDEITSTGDTPLQYMLRVMRDSEASPAWRDAMAIAAAPYVHSKLAQVDAAAQEKQNITGVRFWTEEEWLAHRDAQQGNSRLIANDVNDADVIDNRMNTSSNMAELSIDPDYLRMLIAEVRTSMAEVPAEFPDDGCDRAAQRRKAHPREKKNLCGLTPSEPKFCCSNARSLSPNAQEDMGKDAAKLWLPAAQPEACLVTLCSSS